MLGPPSAASLVAQQVRRGEGSEHPGRCPSRRPGSRRGPRGESSPGPLPRPWGGDSDGGREPRLTPSAPGLSSQARCALDRPLGGGRGRSARSPRAPPRPQPPERASARAGRARGRGLAGGGRARLSPAARAASGFKSAPRPLAALSPRPELAGAAPAGGTRAPHVKDRGSGRAGWGGAISARGGPGEAGRARWGGFLGGSQPPPPLQRLRGASADAAALWGGSGGRAAGAAGEGRGAVSGRRLARFGEGEGETRGAGARPRSPGWAGWRAGGRETPSRCPPPRDWRGGQSDAWGGVRSPVWVRGDDLGRCGTKRKGLTSPPGCVCVGLCCQPPSPSPAQSSSNSSASLELCPGGCAWPPADALPPFLRGSWPPPQARRGFQTRPCQGATRTVCMAPPRLRKERGHFPPAHWRLGRPHGLSDARDGHPGPWQERQEATWSLVEPQDSDG